MSTRMPEFEMPPGVGPTAIAGATMTLGGTPAPQGDLLLYPGLYAVDGTDDGLFVTIGITVSVYGDPGTMTELSVQRAVVPGTEGRANSQRLEARVRGDFRAAPTAWERGPLDLSTGKVSTRQVCPP